MTNVPPKDQPPPREAGELSEKGGILVHGGKPSGPLEDVQEQLREERIRSGFPAAWR